MENKSDLAKPSKKPGIDIFRTVSFFLKIHGIARSKPGGRPFIKSVEVFNRVVNVYTITMLLSGINFQDPEKLTTALESVTFFLVTFPSIFTVTVCSLRKKRIFALFDRINNLLAEIEDDFGPNAMKPADLNCRKVAWAHVALFAFCIPPPFINVYYTYYVKGVPGVAPYTINIPFGKSQNVHYNAICQFMVFFYPITGNIMLRVVFGSLVSGTTLIIEKTRWKFEQLTASNNGELLRQAARWHSEAIQIVNETNSILGIIFSSETISSMTYICNGTFIFFKFGMKDDKYFYKSLGELFSFICLPLYFCMCGHRISDEGDKLYWSICHNEWYEMSPKNRRDMLVPSTMALRGISWGYRRFVQYDMSTYLFVIKQSYSFYTLLSVMDNA